MKLDNHTKVLELIRRIEELKQLYWVYLTVTSVFCLFTLLFMFLPIEVCFRGVVSLFLSIFTLAWGIATYGTRSEYQRLEVKLFKYWNDER